MRPVVGTSAMPPSAAPLSVTAYGVSRCFGLYGVPPSRTRVSVETCSVSGWTGSEDWARTTGDQAASVAAIAACRGGWLCMDGES